MKKSRIRVPMQFSARVPGQGSRKIAVPSGGRIRIIITGGTFDKHYDEIKGKFTFHDTHLPDILKDGRCRLPIILETVRMIDSLDMSHLDRLKILDLCREAPESLIIITHGTDTMAETAAVLGRAGLKKTIVLTGAMIPFLMRHSDAPFNLAASIVAVQTLPSGVYVCMNGAVFNWDNVRKNRRKGIFEQARG